MTPTDFSREALRRSVASVCRTIGWQAIHSSALEVLVHVLEKQVLTVATRARRYAEHRRSTVPELRDLAMAFHSCDVRLDELREYCECVPPEPRPLDPPPFPLPTHPRLNFLKPGSREVVTRPVHVHEHLPPTRPPDEGDAVPSRPAPEDVFKRPPDPAPPQPERLRRAKEAPARELSSVMMTTSGFLSPAREGRLPEARTPPGTQDGAKPPRAPDVPDVKPKKAPARDGPKKERKRPGSTFKPEALLRKPRPQPPALFASVPPPAPRIPQAPHARIRPPFDTPRPIKREVDPPEVLPPPIAAVDSPPPAPLPPPPPVVIKEEKRDDEKLTSQPDPSKLTIFKKISAKSKDDFRTVEPKVERSPPRKSSPPPPPIFGGIKIKEEPLDDYPRDPEPEPEPSPPPAPPPPPVQARPPVRPKLSVLPESVLLADPVRERKEKKRREKKSKEKREPERVVEPPTFPFFGAGPGLIPNGGLIPGLHPAAPGVASENLFSSLCGNPALRGLLRPDFLPNPFSMGPTPLGFPFGGGVPPRPADRPAFGRPPDLPAYLRRPSLEVIPIDDRGEERPVVHPRPEPQESRFPAVDRPPKFPPIRPDVTIEPNPPRERPSPEVAPPPPPLEKTLEVEPSERKKDKIHKKEKRDRDQKAKKKKEKKDKAKLKLEKKREKEELKERIKKEKKEKRREKEKATVPLEGIVPKLTLKLGPASPMPPSSPDPAKRLNIKPVVKREEPVDPPPPEREPSPERGRSPELARISALVTRPPKQKSRSKPEPSGDGGIDSPPDLPSDSPPSKKSKQSSSSGFAKYKRIYFKPIPKRGGDDFDDPTDVPTVAEPPPPERPPVRIPPVPVGAHFYEDPEGNKVWLCPACGAPDNGTPMIGCDGCDGWYHWVCVGIVVDPGDSGDWYCKSCIAKKTALMSAMSGTTGKKRGRKPKSEKLKEAH